MKTARKVIGIISVVLFFVISLQSCAAGVYNSLADTGEVSGTAGFTLAVFMLIAGIIGITIKDSFGAIATAIALYILGGIIGVANIGSYGDLTVWSILSIAFAIIYAISLPSNKDKDKNNNE